MRERAYNWKMNRALEFINHERKHYRNVQSLLRVMERQKVIEAWELTPNGFAKIKAGGEWRILLIR